MRLTVMVSVIYLALGCGPAFAQASAAPPQARAVTRTMYARNTELFAEWRPFVVGQPTRLIAHLTQTGDRFTPYTSAKVTLILTVEGSTVNAAADGPERPGVFRLNVTPTKAGNARVTIEVQTAGEPVHFVFDEIPVYADMRAALAKDVPEAPGLVSYPKERSWETDFATARVTLLFPGAGSVVTVPSTAVVRDGDVTQVYVQRTPERFEFREVRTRRTVGDLIEIVSGLTAGERIVVRGAAGMPRPQ